MKLYSPGLEDASQMAELERECQHEPWSEKSFSDSMQRHDMLFLGMEENGRLIGLCSLQYFEKEGTVNNVSVKTEYRRKGIGKEMLTELFRQGKELGVTDYTLEVRSSNRVAIRLYTELGFESAGVRKNFYDHPKEDALIMWKRSKGL